LLRLLRLGRLRMTMGQHAGVVASGWLQRLPWRPMDLQAASAEAAEA
jgi:hypothetical protein